MLRSFWRRVGTTGCPLKKKQRAMRKTKKAQGSSKTRKRKNPRTVPHPFGGGGKSANPGKEGKGRDYSRGELQNNFSQRVNKRMTGALKEKRREWPGQGGKSRKTFKKSRKSPVREWSRIRFGGKDLVQPGTGRSFWGSVYCSESRGGGGGGGRTVEFKISQQTEEKRRRRGVGGTANSDAVDEGKNIFP